jgi:transposase
VSVFYLDGCLNKSFFCLARSILRTFIDEGRVSAKQRAGTRLRFITEEEAEMIREMKRNHPLITIGQIQMRLQRTSNRVLSKASISRILTNSIRLGKRAKRSNEGDDDDDQDGNNELMNLSSDEGTGGVMYIDDEVDDDEDDEDEIVENNSSLQNLDDFQRFMLRKTSVNGDESTGHEGLSWDTKGRFNFFFNFSNKKF